MQLEFLWRDGITLKDELERQTKQAIEVILTDNTSSIMTYKPARGGRPANLRIHRMFLFANATVVRALATWLTRKQTRQAGGVIDAFIHENEYLLRQSGPRRIQVSTRGHVFNLRHLYDEVNEEHFHERVDAPITWGKMPTRRHRRSIRLGSYTPEDHVIRIHPYLDQEFVPRYFVRYIVFHEMLHAHLGIEHTPSGRRRVHTPEFKRIEAEYPDFDRSVEWQADRQNLSRLLGYRVGQARAS